MNTSEEAIDYIVKTRFILDYAFLGSKISLDYLSQNNYIQKYAWTMKLKPKYLNNNLLNILCIINSYCFIGIKIRKYFFM